jgi:hypothetical protein
VVTVLRKDLCAVRHGVCLGFEGIVPALDGLNEGDSRPKWSSGKRHVGRSSVWLKAHIRSGSKLFATRSLATESKPSNALMPKLWLPCAYFSLHVEFGFADCVSLGSRSRATGPGEIPLSSRSAELVSRSLSGPFATFS